MHNMRVNVYLHVSGPNGPYNISIPLEALHEENATIKIRPKDDRYDHYEVLLYTDNDEPLKTFNTNIVTNLTAGTNYKVAVFTATSTELRSSENITQVFNTSKYFTIDSGLVPSKLSRMLALIIIIFNI